MSLLKPVHPVTLPADLVGVPNGEVPAELLCSCGVKSAYSPFNPLNMHHLASRAMKAMVAAAMKDFPNKDIRGTGTMRTLAQQQLLFDGTNPLSWHTANGRYVPQAEWAGYEAQSLKWALPLDIRSWKGQLWKRRAGTAMAAVPGTSNHGLGLAIDFSEEIDGNPATSESITRELTQWLIDHAAAYGYSAESQSEDWHWRYWAGDAIPQAVLDYEHPPVPPDPTPPVYDEDMLTLYRDERYNNVFLVSGDVTTIGPKLYQRYVDAEVVLIVDTHDQSLFSFMRKSEITRAQLVWNGTGTEPNFPTDLNK